MCPACLTNAGISRILSRYAHSLRHRLNVLCGSAVAIFYSFFSERFKLYQSILREKYITSPRIIKIPMLPISKA